MLSSITGSGRDVDCRVETRPIWLKASGGLVAVTTHAPAQHKCGRAQCTFAQRRWHSVEPPECTSLPHSGRKWCPPRYLHQLAPAGTPPHRMAPIGNMIVHPQNTAENVAFASTPSSIPSTGKTHTNHDLSRIIENWSRLSPAAQTVLLAAIEAAAIKP